jgi:hypothetical protein
MAAARQRSDWMRAAMTTAWLINRNGFTKEAVSPLQIIPPCFRPPPEPARQLTPEELESESRLAWNLLDTCFGRRG